MYGTVFRHACFMIDLFANGEGEGEEVAFLLGFVAGFSVCGGGEGPEEEGEALLVHGFAITHALALLITRAGVSVY